MQIWWYVIKWICQCVNRLCSWSILEYNMILQICLFLITVSFKHIGHTFHWKFKRETFGTWQVFIVAEHLFCTYFLVEWCVRFGAFENKRHLGANFFEIFSSIHLEFGSWHVTRHLRWLFAGFLVAFWWLADVCYCFWARDPQVDSCVF